MEFKFKKSPLKITVGAIWLTVAILNLALMLLLSANSYLLAALPLVTAALSLLLGFYYLDPFSRNYLVIDKQGLWLHQGLFRSQKRIYFDSVETLMEAGNRIRLQARSGEESEILLDSLELRGIKAVRGVLLEACPEKWIP